MSDQFYYIGTYRVQSSLSVHTSELSGTWFAPEPPCLTLEDVNRSLTGHHHWRGGAKVSLRAAQVEARSGAFAAHADALYYRRFFSPSNGSRPPEGDILDVSKLRAHWTNREGFVRALFPASHYENLIDRVASVERTATNEYMCHEAGHLLGIDVHTKYEGGHFRPGSQPAWPLIYVEEFRADLESFAFALELLPPEQACAVFAYHVCHRFGLACESGQTDCAGAGGVPYLLFHLLRELGFAQVKKGAERHLHLNDLSTDGIIRTMRACAKHGASFLTEPEMGGESLLDAALVGAAYYRARALDERTLEEFWSLVSNS